MPSLLQRTITLGAVLLGLSTAWLACGKSTDNNVAPSCTADPLACGTGTTCWPITKSGAASCLPGKDYKLRGDDCELIVGDTTCGEALICATASVLKSDGSAVQSFCTSYCDTGRGKGCLGDETCMPLNLIEGAPAVSVCVPRDLPRDRPRDMAGIDLAK